MRFAVLSILTLIAFASNSVLNRMALVDGDMDATSFGAIRLIAGAAMLWALAMLGRGGALWPHGDWRGAAALFVYIFGFSFAYLSLDAGLGALILFGMVQITMFAGGLWHGERPPGQRWIGAVLAFSGLVWLLWPGGNLQVSLLHGAAMLLAGIGWGIYSLLGRGASDPLRATAVNFVYAAPFGVALAVVVAWGQWPPLTTRGVTLAMISGAITSGLGYAMWYSVLPRLSASVAAVGQLTVPVVAMGGGLLFLGEPIGWAFVLPAALVLGGVAVSVQPFQNWINSRGS